MIVLQRGVNVIEQYPFRKEGLVVDILGKPTDWLAIVKEVGPGFEVLARHVHALGALGEKKIVCPKPTHSTEITSSKNLKVFQASRGQAALYREGVEADGAQIQLGEVYALASADCPTVGIHDPEDKQTLVCHFSRQTGVQGNILEKALGHFGLKRRAFLIAVVSLGISTENFEHSWLDSNYATQNKEFTGKLVRTYGPHAVSVDETRGGINLRYIAIAQLLKGGIPVQNIYADALDTFADPAFWSHRASTTPTSSKFGEKGRNMVLVGNL